jgi:APA family basic amino acid/polyamine antiporter
MSETSNSIESAQQSLQRHIGLVGATALGLGAILGTGVFVTLVTVAQAHGINVLLGIVIAALVATCNGLSSAQLAAAYPVSGGTYEYAYRLLNPACGFCAGWLFLCAKSASAAAAALGAANYLQHFWPDTLPLPSQWLAVVILLTVGLIAIAGIRFANWFNAVLVFLSISALGCFVWESSAVSTIPLVTQSPRSSFTWWDSFHAAAIMFVAFTGYGRIATLGEEVKRPRQTIPKAVLVTLLMTGTIYLIVALAVLHLLRAQQILEHENSEPLRLLSLAEQRFSSFAIGWISIGAVASMLAVENNLVLGLSRVVLAMGRRGDLPNRLARLGTHTSSPTSALAVVVLAVAATILFSEFKVAWEFSALTVLIYYGITNLCALRLSGCDRMFPVWVPFFGLVSTTMLTVFIEPWLWGVALGLLLLGVLVRFLVQKSRI